MLQYLIILGNNYSLCKAEIFYVLNFYGIPFKEIIQKDQVLIIETTAEFDIQKVIKRSGGTIKIAEIIFKTNDLQHKLLDYFDKLNVKTFDFGFSIYGDHGDKSVFIAALAKELKKHLKSKQISARYILSNDGELSSVVITKQKIQEFILFLNNEWMVAKTVAVQDFEDWGKRDFKRPYPSPKSGMLPPKVARIMVNLAIEPDTKLLLDPFCGSGTILQEALGSGIDVIGSDISKKAIQNAQNNLDWFIGEYKIINQFKLYTVDAVKLTYLENKVDCIVTEPYLGPIDDRIYNYRPDDRQNTVNIDTKKLENIITGLEKMYLGCLKQWRKYLTDKGVIVIAIPSFFLWGREYHVKKVVDNFSRLGYIIREGPLPYFRPKAIVRRNIYVLTNNLI